MIVPLQKDDVLLADIRHAEGDALHFWWLGQSGFLLKHDGSYLLIDPYLSDALTQKYAATDKPHVRMTERCIAPAALGFVKLVCSSHQHTDHFDEATLRPLAEAAGGIQLVVGAAVEAQARHRMEGSVVTWQTIDEGQTLVLDGWSITGIAAAHNEIERDALGQCKFLGFLVRRAGFTIHHSGDTLLHPGLETVLRPANCDVMFLPINGNKPERRVAGNMSGAESAQLASACNAKLAIPHHFEMFEFNTASPDEFTAHCTQLSQAFKVMRCGERISLPAR